MKVLREGEKKKGNGKKKGERYQNSHVNNGITRLQPPPQPPQPPLPRTTTTSPLLHNTIGRPSSINTLKTDSSRRGDGAAAGQRGAPAGEDTVERSGGGDEGRPQQDPHLVNFPD